MDPRPNRLGRHIVKALTSPLTLAAVAASTIGIVGALTLRGRFDAAQFGMTFAAVSAPVAFASAAAILRATRAVGRSARRVWLLMALGLGIWGLAAIPYFGFLAAGGDPYAPAWWSQIGWNLPYVVWIAALWQLRLPVVKGGTIERVRRVSIELAALALIGLAIYKLLYQETLTPYQNAALLIPSVLGLLIVAGLYTALRRSQVGLRTAQTVIALAFLLLTATDFLNNFLIPRGILAGLVPGQMMYPVVLGILGFSARFELRMTLARSSIERSTQALATVALALTAPALLILGEQFTLAILALTGLLLWAALAILGHQGDGDVDSESGHLRDQAFEHHLQGMVDASSTGRMACVAIVDFPDFLSWVARRGPAVAQETLRRIGARLEEIDLRTPGAWGRLGNDRFAFATMAATDEAAREIAAAIQREAARIEPDLDADIGFALAPADGASAGELIRAGTEAVTAGRRVGRKVTAFDRGLLDGAPGDSEHSEASRARRTRILATLADPEAIWSALQPIVDLTSGRVLGFEALARFEPKPTQPPDAWIRDARAAALGDEMEVELFRRAWARRADLRPGQYLAVNISPATITSTEFAEVLADADLSRLVIELTEHDEVSDYSRLLQDIAGFRARGARMAIDDAGAGHSSLRHIVRLRPDFVKLDRSLVQHLDDDGAKRAIVRSMLYLTEELDAVLVAEGVETLEELAALRRIGVRAGQGYLFQRPQREASPAEIPIPTGDGALLTAG